MLLPLYFSIDKKLNYLETLFNYFEVRILKGFYNNKNLTQKKIIVKLQQQKKSTNIIQHEMIWYDCYV